MTGTGVVLPTLHAQGYTLVATGHGSFSGSVSVALP
jgi:hypothetical protein